MYTIYGNNAAGEYAIYKPDEDVPHDQGYNQTIQECDTLEEAEALVAEWTSNKATKYVIYGNIAAGEATLYCPGEDVPRDCGYDQTICIFDTLEEAEALVAEWKTECERNRE